MQQHLGVRFGAEGEAFGLQLFAQLAVVVDFAVKDQHQRAAVIQHGLCALLGEVDDGKSAMSQRDVLVHI